MKVIAVQNQENRPDIIRTFWVNELQYKSIEAQLAAGVDIVEVHRPDGHGQAASFPSRFYKGLAEPTKHTETLK